MTTTGAGLSSMRPSRWHRFRRRTSRWLRHAETSVIVPIGLVAAMGSLAAGCVEDVALIAGLHYSNGHFLTRLWYDGLLPSVGGLFCVYFSIKARFVVVRTLALLHCRKA